MRPVVIASVLLVGLSVAGCGGSKKKTTGCPPPPSTSSAGNAQISAKAVGASFNKVIVIHATEKSNGAPVHGDLTVNAQMTCPHFMPMYTKALPETSAGTYKGAYSLVMPGNWTFNIILRAKNGDATTSSLPVTVKPSG